MPPEDREAASTQIGDPGSGVSGLAVGRVLARRYRIVWFIASGGMGEVYEAEDIHLGVRVALKTIRADGWADPAAGERFKREVLLARQVTHPNVCRIFDLGVHEEANRPPLTFLTMELLEGETLAERVQRRTRLTVDEALPLVQQLADGLQAAHDAGVVHRDFKAGNVILARFSGGSERAVITDFGLARPAPTTSQQASTLAAFVGTPAYMAPEQVEGRPAGPAADVYALGIVLYEMVTGERPFRAETAVLEAMKRLNESPSPPSSKVPDLPAAWEDVILRCLARQPEARFARVADVAAALRVAPARSRRRVRWAGLVAAAALATALGVAGWLALGPHPAREPAAAGTSPGGTAAPLRRCVAILGFHNVTGRPEAGWISTALAEMLSSELAAGESLRLIAGETVARLRADLRIPEAGALAADTLQAIRQSTGADLVVVGSYLAAAQDAGGKVRLDLRVQETATGESRDTLIETGTEGDLPELATRVGASLRARLGIGSVPGETVGAARAEFPANPEAARLYAEGIARLWAMDGMAARDLLARAAGIEPDHPMIHRALARAFSSIGQERLAREEARRAYETSSGLPREARLAIEADHWLLSGQPAKAVEILRALRAFFPDRLDHGIRLADALLAAGQPADAYAYLAELRKLPAPLGEDPQIDLAEARIGCTSGEFPRCLEMSQRAALRARQQGVRLLLAQALYFEAFARVRRGEAALALPLLEQARDIWAADGDHLHEAHAVNAIGGVHYNYGRVRKARVAYADGLAICRKVESAPCQVIGLTNLSLIDLHLGDLASARRLGEEARRTADQAQNRSMVTMAGLDLAVLTLFEGDIENTVAGARRVQGEAEANGELAIAANARWVLAEGLLASGQPVAAEAELREALGVCQRTDLKFLELIVLGSLARCRLAADDRDVASRTAREATALGEATENGLWGALAHAIAAEVALASGDAALAATSARRGIAMLEGEPVAWVRAQAESVLARALLARGDTVTAAAIAGKAQESATASGVPQVRLATAITSARVRVAGRQSTAAIRALEEIVAEASRRGLVAVSLEARLELGRAQLAAGRRPEGAATLKALAEDARSRRFLLLAREASTID